MQEIYSNSVMEKIRNKSLRFQVPTTISNLEPIFIFKILISPNPSFAINLNPNLNQNNLKSDATKYLFNSDGQCSFIHNDQNDYYIKGDLKLMGVKNTKSNEISQCKMSITYGKGKSELFYLKGTFNLSEFEQN